MQLVCDGFCAVCTFRVSVKATYITSIPAQYIQTAGISSCSDKWVYEGKITWFWSDLGSFSQLTQVMLKCVLCVLLEATLLNAMKLPHLLPLLLLLPTSQAFQACLNKSCLPGRGWIPLWPFALWPHVHSVCKVRNSSEVLLMGLGLFFFFFIFWTHPLEGKAKLDAALAVSYGWGWLLLVGGYKSMSPSKKKKKKPQSFSFYSRPAGEVDVVERKQVWRRGAWFLIWFETAAGKTHNKSNKISKK